MILTPEKTIEAHRQSGIWGNVTLDALFRKTAAATRSNPPGGGLTEPSRLGKRRAAEVRKTYSDPCSLYPRPFDR